MESINFWPILVATIVAFGISALWYSPILFGKEWMALTKVTDKDVRASQERGVWKLYLTQFIVTIVVFAVLGFLIAATGSLTAMDGAFLAFLVWVGFSLTAAVGQMLWRMAPLKLVAITEICTLLTWVIGGAIIGAWR